MSKLSLKIEEIRKMKREDLIKLLEDQKLQLLKLNAEKAARGTVDKPGTLKVVKKNIARILATLGESK